MKKHAMNIIKFIKNKYRQHKYKQIAKLMGEPLNISPLL